jgi:hypothetical protein
MTGFQVESPLRQARRYSDRELANRGSALELRWLHDHLVLWMQALAETQRDVENHIAQVHRDLDAIRPTSGQDQSEYLRAKAAATPFLTVRQNFRRLVTQRRAEVAALLGDQPVMTTGDIVGRLATIVQLIDDDDITDARAAALALIERLAQR